MYKQTEIETLSAYFYLWTLATSGQNTATRRDRIVAKFLSHYPRKQRPQDFSSIELMDYRDARLASGMSGHTVGYEISHLKCFWRWMIEVRELPLLLPAVIRVPRPPYRGEDLSLLDLDRILGLLPDPRVRQAVLGVAGGAPIKKAAEAAGIHWTVVQSQMRDAGRQLEIGWLNLRRFRRSIRNAVLAHGVAAYSQSLRAA